MEMQADTKPINDENSIVPIKGICYTNKTIKVQVEWIQKFFGLSAFELDFIFFVATNIDRIDEENKRIEFKILDVARSLKLNSNNCYQYIDEITDKIQAKPIRIKLDSDDDELTSRHKNYEKIYWFTFIRCSNGKLLIEFSPRMIEFFKNVQNRFALIYFAELKQLKSIYSKKFYLECRAFGFKGKVEYTIEELRDKFKLKPKEYKQYSDFKKKVIKTAYDELMSKSNVYFEFEEKKKGKKVISIVFKFYKKEMPKKPPENGAGELPIVTLVDVLVKYGISKKNSNKYVAELDEETINQKIEFCLEYQKTHTVKNFGGLLNGALEGAYGKKSEFDLEKEEEERRKAEDAAKLKEYNEKLETVYNKLASDYRIYRENLVKEYTQGDLFEELKKEFSENLPSMLVGRELKDSELLNFKSSAGHFFGSFVVKKYGLEYSDWLKQNYNAEENKNGSPKYIRNIETKEPILSLEK